MKGYFLLPAAALAALFLASSCCYFQPCHAPTPCDDPAPVCGRPTNGLTDPCYTFGPGHARHDYYRSRQDCYEGAPGSCCGTGEYVPASNK